MCFHTIHMMQPNYNERLILYFCNLTISKPISQLLLCLFLNFWSDVDCNSSDSGKQNTQVVGKSYCRDYIRNKVNRKVE